MQVGLLAIVEAENPRMAIKKKICSQKENEKDVAISAWGTQQEWEDASSLKLITCNESGASKVS